MWSYPNIRYPTNRSGLKSKEVCDLLVVFEEHVIIFSDKDIAYKPHDDPKVAWRRWYKNAVEKSANQFYGAERKIRENPDQLYLDEACTQRFPIPIPPPGSMKIHRIAVAHGAGEASRQYFGGGTGSLMIAPQMLGEDHLLEGEDTFAHIPVVSETR